MPPAAALGTEDDPAAAGACMDGAGRGSRATEAQRPRGPGGAPTFYWELMRSPLLLWRAEPASPRPGLCGRRCVPRWCVFCFFFSNGAAECGQATYITAPEPLWQDVLWHKLTARLPEPPCAPPPPPPPASNLLPSPCLHPHPRPTLSAHSLHTLRRPPPPWRCASSAPCASPAPSTGRVAGSAASCSLQLPQLGGSQRRSELRPSFPPTTTHPPPVAAQ